MSLQIWLPLTGHTKNKGVWNSTAEFYPSNTNFITVDNSGKLGQCYAFNSTATNTGIYHADGNYMAEHINNHSFSICAWIQTTATDTCVISLSYGVRIYVGDSSHTYITLYNSSRTYACSAGLATNDGKWHHVCGIYNVDTNKIQFYVDGIMKKEVSYADGYTYASSWSNGLFVGRDPNNSTVNDHYHYKGKMNDVRVYDHALSSIEVSEIAKGLVCHYKLDDIMSSDNLIVNGFGELGSENWNDSSRISTTEIPPNHPEIKASFYSGVMTKEYIPICQDHRYTISGYIKAMANQSGTTYPSLWPYDIDKKFIQYQNSQAGFNTATATTLRQPLRKGDTVIYATDLSQWTTADNYYFYVAIFGYKNSFGETYPDLFYTNESPKFGSRTDKSNIDKTNNTITLLSAFNGDDRPAGTMICQATEGSTYFYPWGGISISSISDWVVKTSTFKPSSNTRLRAAAYLRWNTYSKCYIAGSKLVDNFFNDDRIIDSSGYGNHGTKNGNVTMSYETGRYSASTMFDGSTAYIEAPGLPLETKTISVWVKTAWVTPPSSAYKHIMLDKQSGLSLGWGAANGNFITYVGSAAGGTGSCIDIRTTTYSANQWNHIVVVKTGDTTRDVYVNGVKAAPSTNNYWSGDQNNLNIGCRHSGGVYKDYFGGQLSDFRAYVTALSADDVKRLYEVSASVSKNGSMLGYEMKEG